MEIPGRTFPVEQFFLEDVVDMVGYIVEETSPYAKRLPKGGMEVRPTMQWLLNSIV